MSPRQQIARLLPLVLLIVLVIAGLRGAVPAPGWDGRLKAYGVEIGIALEVIFIVCLVIVHRRDQAAKQAAELAPYDPATLNDGIAPVSALRFTLKYVLTAGVIGGALALLLNLHLHFFSKSSEQPPPLCPQGKKGTLAHPCLAPLTPHANIPKSGSGGFDIGSVAPILYALLIVALVAAIAVSIWWGLRQRRVAAPLIGIPDITDEEELRDAVEEGRAALDTLEDDRAAIIACYVAMERRLAERGTARSVADTPDELLAKAVAAGTVSGDAAGRLTELFYEARFSTHPLAGGQREAASAALDELAAKLKAKLEPAPSGAASAAEKPGGGWV